MLEMKAIVAMTAREFDIRSAYDEWNVVHSRKKLKRVGTELIKLSLVAPTLVMNFSAELQSRLSNSVIVEKPTGTSSRE